MYTNRLSYLFIVFALLLITACAPQQPPITLSLAVSDGKGRAQRVIRACLSLSKYEHFQKARSLLNQSGMPAPTPRQVSNKA